jgi:hypothetical protein
MLTLAEIAESIERGGLVTRGGFALDEIDRRADLEGVSAIVLVGAAGAHGWSAFANSPEARDRAADPLDRWSRRVIGALATALGARALYPFGGPPHRPFQRWAMRAEAVNVSPLGLLIHPDYGLWHSYRGALAFAEPIAMPARDPRPVGAFGADGYDVGACAAHLRRPAGLACMDGGCLARRACPIGAPYAHDPAQAAFHMRAFLSARGLSG